MIGAVRRQLSHVCDRRIESSDVAGKALVSREEPDRFYLISPAAPGRLTMPIEQLLPGALFPENGPDQLRLPGPGGRRSGAREIAFSPIQVGEDLGRRLAAPGSVL